MITRIQRAKTLIAPVQAIARETCRKPLRIVAAGLVILTMGASALAEEAVGSVRVTDQRATTAGLNGAAAGAGGMEAASPAAASQQTGAPDGGPVVYLTGNRLTDWYRIHQVENTVAQGCDGEMCPNCHRPCRHGGHCHGSGSGCDGCDGDRTRNHFIVWHGACCDENGCGRGHGLCGHCCLLGPDGGYGCRILDCHCYNMAYPIDPWYFDRRDAPVYAAQGFGAPMAVPLAPNVTQQYNYGWGIPSSRITHISRVAQQPGALPGTVAPR